MDKYLNKKYKLVESENYDKFLKRTKVKLFYRKLEPIVKQVIKLSEKDGKYVFVTFWPMMAASVTFRPGVPFDETRIDGVVSRSMIEFRDNKMIHHQTVKDVEATFVREYSDKQVKETVTCEDLTSQRLYARVFEK